MRPFGEQGPYLRPGEGCPTVLALIQVNDSEQRAKKQCVILLRSDMPSTSLNANDSDTHEWYLDNPIDCLELLSELEQYRQTTTVRMEEWPRGQKYHLQKTVSHKDIRFSVKSQQQWFEYDSEVTLYNDKTCI